MHVNFIFVFSMFGVLSQGGQNDQMDGFRGGEGSRVKIFSKLVVAHHDPLFTGDLISTPTDIVFDARLVFRLMRSVYIAVLRLCASTQTTVGHEIGNFLLTCICIFLLQTVREES